jgi:hypothetical protein
MSIKTDIIRCGTFWFLFLMVIIGCVGYALLASIR